MKKQGTRESRSFDVPLTERTKIWLAANHESAFGNTYIVKFCQWECKPDFARIEAGLLKPVKARIETGLVFWGQVDWTFCPD
jgi:hypothetical protein